LKKFIIDLVHLEFKLHCSSLSKSKIIRYNLNMSLFRKSLICVAALFHGISLQAIPLRGNSFYEFDESRFFYPLNIEVGAFLAGPVPLLQMHAEDQASELNRYLQASQSGELAQEQIGSLIDEAVQAGSIDAFLEKFLPERGSRYLVVHRSRSLQEASPTRPRIVVFDHRHSWAFSFTHPENRGGSLLEFTQFNPKKRQFEFQSVDFSQSKPVVSELNPPRCLRCHSGGTYSTTEAWKNSRSEKIFSAFGPRPNWDSGFIWRGFMGGRNDSNFWVNDLTTAIESVGAFTELSLFQDHDWLTDFYANHSQGNRYRFLKPLPTERTFYHRTRNATYNLNVSFRNAERVAQGLMRLENYPKIRNPMRQILCREDLENESAPAATYNLEGWPGDYQPLASGLLRRGGLKASLDLAKLFQEAGYTQPEVFEIFRLMNTSFRFSETNGTFAFYTTPGADQTFSSRWLLSPLDGNPRQFLNLFSVTCQILNAIDPVSEKR